MSKLWKVPPSELYAITDPLTAYYFNRAVMYFGSAYEADMDRALDTVTNSDQKQKQAKAKMERIQEQVNQRWLTDDEPAESTDSELSDDKDKPKFRDPADFINAATRRPSGNEILKRG